jgi:hypothetical protein
MVVDDAEALLQRFDVAFGEVSRELPKPNVLLTVSPFYPCPHFFLPSPSFLLLLLFFLFLCPPFPSIFFVFLPLPSSSTCILQRVTFFLYLFSPLCVKSHLQLAVFFFNFF